MDEKLPHSVTDRDSEGFVGRRDIVKGLDRLNGLMKALIRGRHFAFMTRLPSNEINASFSAHEKVRRELEAERLREARAAGGPELSAFESSAGPSGHLSP